MADADVADMSGGANVATNYLQITIFCTVRSGHDRGQTPVMAGRGVAAGNLPDSVAAAADEPIMRP